MSQPERWTQTLAGLRLASTANASRASSRLAQSRTKRTQRELARLLVAANGPVPALPVTVTLVRVGPRALDDDNLAYAAKALRDGVADALGVRDNDPRVTWTYAQERGDYAVRVELARREA